MATLTAEESRQECINVMGEKLGSVFYQLRVELVFLGFYPDYTDGFKKPVNF